MALMEMEQVIPLTTRMGWMRRKRARGKSFNRFELMALIKEVAVEMIAANTAHPTKALIQGLVKWAMDAIKTLPPGATCRPAFFAKEPKKTGTVQMAIVKTPAQKAALETTLEEAPAKQRCPISCSMSMKSSGMSSHPVNFEET